MLERGPAFVGLLPVSQGILRLGDDARQRGSQHEFATMAAVGANLRQIGSFVWSDAGLVLAAALLLAAGLGSLLALMLIAMLQHVFDPPPDHLSVPWAYLGGLAGAAVATTLVALGVTAMRLKALPLGRLLREQ